MERSASRTRHHQCHRLVEAMTHLTFSFIETGKGSCALGVGSIASWSGRAGAVGSESSVRRYEIAKVPERPLPAFSNNRGLSTSSLDRTGEHVADLAVNDEHVFRVLVHPAVRPVAVDWDQ